MHSFEAYELKLSVLIALTLLIACLCLMISCSAHAADWEHIFPAEYDVLLASDGERLYAGTEHGVFFSLDDGSIWRESDLKHGISVIEIGPDAVYAVTYFRGIYRSDTRGNTWHPKNEGMLLFQSDHDDGYHPHVRQILVASSGMVIAVAYHQGTWISRNRGESWHDITEEWIVAQGQGLPDLNIGNNVYSMTEFDGYLWVAWSASRAMRTADEGATWENIPYWGFGSIAEFGRIHDWMVLDNNLYAAGSDGFGRWREDGLKWENLSRGLPRDHHIRELAVNRGRIFGAVGRWGVGYFHHSSETWLPAGLRGRWVSSVVSHRGDLYAGTREGIYRAAIPVVQPYNKAATTWARVKQGVLAK